MKRSLLVLAAASLLPSVGVAGSRYERRWVYCAQNLLVDRNADATVGLIERAAKSGYNGILLADYKFNILDRMPPNYARNVERVRRAADAAGIEIVPAVFPVGYSSGLLAHDPNLAEGLPVADAPFVARAREAVPDPAAAPEYVNGGLEQTKGDRFSGFSFQDDPGKATAADTSVAHSGKTSCRIRDVAKTSASGNGRLVQRVRVRPHAAYRFSCWVKTQDLSSPGAFHLLALGARGGRQLTFHEGGAGRTQDWTHVALVFNTLDQAEVNLYVGLWGGGTGTLWVDDLRLEDAGLLNVLRRPGCPFALASADGMTTYEEGKDYEPVRDPKLGAVPYAGEFSFTHDGPPVRLTAGSRIKDGAKLRARWYHPVATHGDQVACCLSEPKVYELLRDQARRVDALLHPRMFFMSHDELRVANWCRACQDRRLDAGALLADNAKRCVSIVKEVNPDARVAVWSDMFDPHHNAVKDYYLVNGSLAGSWEGLPHDVLIANWNGGKARESLSWFAERGHPQLIAGYYDGDDLSNFRQWDAAARAVPGVAGFMYTTWANKYGLLEAYGKAMSPESGRGG
jgi:hypothetical protein